MCLFVAPTYAQTDPHFIPSDCPTRYSPRWIVECGELVVPEDHHNPDGERIRLGVAILRNPNKDVTLQPDPIIYLEGGPGASAIDVLGRTLENRYDPFFVTNRDIIVLDQRGVGISSPALDCPNYDAAVLDVLDGALGDDSLSPQQVDAHLVDALVACGEAWAAERDLSLYDTSESAADVDALRRALGYEQVNLWGISYGTRLALAVMRDYPDTVRSVVLDSAYPMDVNLFTELPAIRTQALNRLFESCAADEQCAEAYPFLGDIFYATVAILNDNPLRVNTIDPLTGRIFPDVIFDGDMFLLVTLNLMYSTDNLPLLPQLIYQMHVGDSDLYAVFAGSIFGRQERISIGKYYAVQCREQVNGLSSDELTTAYAAYPPLQTIGDGGLGVDAILEICAAFAVGQTPNHEQWAVASDIPTLLLTGDLDPITPSAWTHRAAASLVNSTVIELPYHGHGATASEDCAQSLAIAFFTAPDSELDTTCVDEFSIEFQGADVPLDLPPAAPMTLK